jgi:NAD kinase
VESHHAHHACFKKYVNVQFERGLSHNFCSLKTTLETLKNKDLLQTLTVRRIDGTAKLAALALVQIAFATDSHFTEVNEEQVNASDAVISVGGDGTFLKVASMIHRPEVLLAGVNSDPNNSIGSLCTMSHDKSAVHAFLENLLRGAHKPLVRSRLQCSLTNFGAPDSAVSNTKLPLALNEVFIASNDPSAVSSFAVSVDGEPEFACKNSGILMSTGTGSAAWLAFPFFGSVILFYLNPPSNNVLTNS